MTSVVPSWVPLVFHEIHDDSPRYGIDMPWVYGGWLWATDGRIMVRRRVASKEEFDSLPRPWTHWKGRRVPDAGPTWDVCRRAMDCNDVRALPEVPKPLTCECLGMDAECEECDGAGRWYPMSSHRLEGDPAVWLTDKYIDLLRRNRVFEVAAGKTSEDAVGFNGPGFSFAGFLMPCGTQDETTYDVLEYPGRAHPSSPAYGGWARR